jgi:asparagine synthase (glutamine-hydrolysing)
LLPKDFAAGRKQGFSVPLASWLERGDWADMFRSVLTDPSCAFCPDAVESLVSGQSRGRNNGERLFGLVLFELWRNAYGAVMI